MATREVLLYGEVTEQTASRIKAELSTLAESDELVVRIDSNGGSVWHGFSIFEAFRKHAGPKRAVIESAAFSIASYIAMAFDEIEMAPNGYMMIHNPTVRSQGDDEQLAKDSALLAKLKDSMVQGYANRTGIGEEEVRRMLKAETYLDANECLALGFASRISGDSVNSRITANYSKLPLRVVASLIGDAPAGSAIHKPSEKETEKMQENSAPKAATLKEIRAAYPDASDKFVLTCLEKELPLASVATAAAEELLKENEELKARIAAMEDEAAAKAMEDEEAAKAEAEAQAKAEEEAEEEAKAKASGTDPIARGDDQARPTATQQWREAVQGFVAQGLPKARAVMAANRSNPGLRERMLEEANAGR